MTLKTRPVRPKKLPDVRVTLSWQKGMPTNWRTWMRSYEYWNGALDE
jgi:hypothetical protein